MLTPSAAGYATEEPTHAPPWHGLVVWDVFFNALTTGLFMTAALGELARPGVFGPVGAWAHPLALVLLLTDLTLLVLDLGDPLRFHHMLRVFKPSSPMSLGTWCLTLYSLPLTALIAADVLVLVGIFPGGSGAFATVRTMLLAVGLPFCFGSMAYKGVLFSTSAQPGWRDARWFGAYHVASALAMGAAVLFGLAVAGGHARAADLLRLPVVVLVVGQAVPLGLLVAELRATPIGPPVRGRLTLVAGLAVGLPLVALPVDGAVGPVAVVLGALVGGWVMRRFLVLLPHADHAPGALRVSARDGSGTGVAPEEGIAHTQRIRLSEADHGTRGQGQVHGQTEEEGRAHRRGL